MTAISSRDTLEILETAIPGFLTMSAEHPVTGDRDSLTNIIANLNDARRWSREAIANWLDSLDLDLEIKPFDKVRPLNGCGCLMCQTGHNPFSPYLMPVSIEAVYEPEPLTVKASDVVYVTPLAEWTLSVPDLTEWKKGIYKQFGIEEPNKEEK